MRIVVACMAAVALGLGAGCAQRNPPPPGTQTFMEAGGIYTVPVESLQNSGAAPRQPDPTTHFQATR